MVGGSIFARFGVVGAVAGDDEVEAVAPAITVVDGVSGELVGWFFGGYVGCLVGIAGGLTALESNAFDISVVEVAFEVGNGLLGSGKFAPFADVKREDAGFFKVVDGDVEDSGVRDGFGTGGSKVLASFDLCP